MATHAALAKLYPAGALTEAFFARLRCAWRREISTCQPYQVFAQLTHGFLLSRGPRRIHKGLGVGPGSATSRFSPIGGGTLGLLKRSNRPSSPAFGHLRNRKQPFDFSTITVVDAKYISDGEIMIGSSHNRNVISSPHVTLDHDS